MSALKLSGVALLLLVLGGCSKKVGDSCTGGVRVCQDPSSALVCNSGKLALVPCKGPNGCVEKDDAVACDFSGNAKGDACVLSDDGVHVCKNDSSEAVCRGGKVVIHSCRGPGACVSEGGKGTCDRAVVDEGDACDDARPGDQKCDARGLLLLTCKDAVWTFAASCDGSRRCRTFNDGIQCHKVEARAGEKCDLSVETACSASGDAVLHCAFAEHDDAPHWSVMSPCPGTCRAAACVAKPAAN